MLAQIDAIASEHGITQRLDTARLRKRCQQPDGFLIQMVLRVINAQTGCFQREARGAGRIFAEQLGQLPFAGLLRVLA